MRWSDSLTAFTERLANSGLEPTSLTPIALARVAADWYRRERVDGVLPFDDYGDMLLLQWGRRALRSPAPALFTFQVARQFIVPRRDRSTIWRLSTTLHFAAAPTLTCDHVCCASPDEIDEAMAFVLAAPELADVRELPADRVDVGLGPAA